MSDAETEARIKGGKLVLTGPDDKVCYTLLPSERDAKIEAGSYKVRVEGADGLTLDTPEFTLKKGGKVVVRVTVAHPTVAKAIDPDRTAAEWVLYVGGMVKVNGQDEAINVGADLPHEAFRLTNVLLNANKKVDDKGLAAFKGCKNLTYLNLYGTPVSDAGLAHFKDCKNLMSLYLGRTQVSDAGLAHFKDCKNLTAFGLECTRVTDAGLAHFKDCKNLTAFGLECTRVTDAGLAHFKDHKSPTGVGLNGTQVSDAGLAAFKDCKNLMSLQLANTKVSDAGLAAFKDCKNLTLLDLSGTQVSDVGLAHFKECKNLMFLYLVNTQVSDAGLADLKDCKNLTGLDLRGTKVSDLSPLKGMPLKVLWCDCKPERDAEILRSIKTLERINDKPAAEFWKEQEAKKP
jgi:uncharacterized membrane protein